MNKLYKNGLTLGKFSPFHKGHKLMIDFGASMCETLYVIVSGETEIPMVERLNALSRTYPSFEHMNVIVYHSDYFDQIPDPELDENGIATDPEFWDRWITGIKKNLPAVDAVFTNDLYGEKLANLIDAKWHPIDSQRTTVELSATDCRNNIGVHYTDICEYAKIHYQRTIAVVGPESTGKSTMTRDLADRFNQGYAHEHGRTLSEVRNNKLTEDDFRSIGIGQKALIKAAHENYPVVFTDTEAFTTLLYSRIYLDETSLDFDEHMIKQIDNTHDFYILLAPTVPWVDDGTRVMPDQEERDSMFYDLRNYLSNIDCEYVVISNKNWADRMEIAGDAVYHYLERQYG